MRGWGGGYEEERDARNGLRRIIRSEGLGVWRKNGK